MFSSMEQSFGLRWRLDPLTCHASSQVLTATRLAQGGYKTTLPPPTYSFERSYTYQQTCRVSYHHPPSSSSLMKGQGYKHHLGFPSERHSHAPSMQLPSLREFLKNSSYSADHRNAPLSLDRDTIPPIRQTPFNSLAPIRPEYTPIPPVRAMYGDSEPTTPPSNLVSTDLSRSPYSLPSSSTPHTGFGTPCVRDTLPSSYPTHWLSGDPGQRGDQAFPHRGPYEALQASGAAYSDFIHRPHFPWNSWDRETSVPGGPDHLLTPNTPAGAGHYEAGPYPTNAGTWIERPSSRWNMVMAPQPEPHYACPPDIPAPAYHRSSHDYTVPFEKNPPQEVPLYHYHSVPSGSSTSGHCLVPDVEPANRADDHDDQDRDCDQDSQYMTPQQTSTGQSVRQRREGPSTLSIMLWDVDTLPSSTGLTKGHSNVQASESMGSVPKRRRSDSGESVASPCIECSNFGQLQLRSAL